MRFATTAEVERFNRIHKVWLRKATEDIAAGATIKRLNTNTFRAEEDMILKGFIIWHGLPNASPLEGGILLHHYPLTDWSTPHEAFENASGFYWVDIHYHSAGGYANTAYFVELEHPIYLEEGDTVIVSSIWANLTAAAVTWADYTICLVFGEKR
jgi:hypothetical protein